MLPSGMHADYIPYQSRADFGLAVQTVRVAFEQMPELGRQRVLHFATFLDDEGIGLVTKETKTCTELY